MKNKMMLGLTALFCIFITWIPVLFTPTFSLANTNDQQLSEIQSSMNALQIPFVANKGQMNNRVAFSARTLGGTLFVTDEGELVYSLSGPPDDPKGRQMAVIRERLVGGYVEGVKGDHPSTVRVNYFRGSNPQMWLSAVRTYMEVSLGEIYDGIELRLKAYGNNVEKLFYVAPGAAPGDIKLNIAGADSLEVNSRGELVLTTPYGPVTFTRPVAWQEIGDETVPVTAEYKLCASAGRQHAYSFTLGLYDPAHPLVIDPLLASTFVGGSGNDTGHAIGVDSQGNVYVTGETESSDFPVEAGYDSSHNGGNQDVFVSKLSADLTTLLASTYIGGTDQDIGYSLAIDSSDNIYIAGKTASSDFPANAYDSTFNTNNGHTDAFIVKLSNDLSTLGASTFLGGASDDEGLSLTVAAGYAYLTGYTLSTNFPTTEGAYDRSHNEYEDIFVAKLPTSLGDLTASTFIGGSVFDFGRSIALDSEGYVFVTGSTTSSNFPSTTGLDFVYGGGTQVMVAKLTSNLSSLSAASVFGSGGVTSIGHGIAVDSTDNIFITGETNSSAFPTTEGAYDRNSNSSIEAFVTRLNNGLTTIAASTFLGTGSWDKGHYLVLDESDNIYVTGYTNSSDFPTSLLGYDRTHNGGHDVFVTKLQPDLTAILASTYLGSNGTDWGWSLARDAAGNIYVTGRTNPFSASGPFPTTAGAYDTVDSYDVYPHVFVSRLDAALAGPSLQFSASGYSVSESGTSKTITVTRSGDSSGAVAVDFATSDGTATAGSDYTTVSGTLNWGDGDAADKTFNVPILDDSDVENGETVTLTLSNPSNIPLASPQSATLTITDDEAAGILQFSGSTFSVAEDATSVTISVTRTDGSDGIVSVNYAATDGTAVDGNDYDATSGTLTWSTGDTAAQTFDVAIIDNNIETGNKTVNLTLSNPTGSVSLGSPNTAVLTIVNDDEAGSLQFSAASYAVDEDAGQVEISVTRTGGSDGAVSVDYATADGTAVDGNNYDEASGTLNWTTGDAAAKTIVVDIIDNNLEAGNKTVNLTLSGTTGSATLGSPNTAVLTIVNDDEAGSLKFSAANYPVSENAGQVVINVTRTDGSDGAVSIEYYTSVNTATIDEDYQSAGGTLNWAHGEAGAQTFSVTILDDQVIEGEEKITLTITNPTGQADLGTPNVANIAINDDDTPVIPGTLQFSMADYSVSESGVQATIAVTRTGDSDGAVSVAYATTDGTATAGSDYTAGSGTLNWTNQETGQKTFTVAVSDDSDNESDETVTLTLSNATGGASLGTTKTATLTIQDNDATLQHGSLQFSVSGYYVWENDGSFSVTVTRTNGSDGEVSVDYATSDGTAGVGGDYDELSGTLTWTNGDGGDKTFDVNIIDDDEAEGDETINLMLSSPSGGAVLGAQSSAVLTIQDNEASQQPGALQFSSSTYNVSETAGQLTITVTRTGGSDGDITVTYATSDGTAVVNDDYYENIGNLDWSDGESGSKTFVVNIEDDSEEEGNETIGVSLIDPVGATLGSPKNATITIKDDESQSSTIIPVLNLLLGGDDL